ncbi:MAG: aldolase catalytic domain-containing protein [Prolixibacteraceae bacterium]|jgi:4-hydroxy 2-oxovalerate aldolase|nr:aldolase catalytic domain-containing protein [Prolixibacteraceae bacterium]
MYKSDIKVLDCTVRDGGLMNKWQFTDEFVRSVYESCAEAGIDYMEIGYKSSERAFDRKEVGPWKFCDEKDIRRIIGKGEPKVKLSALCDIGRIDFEDIPKKSDSAISLMRVACYVHQMDKAIELAHHCLDKGYEVSINLMAVSKVNEMELDQALADLSKSRVQMVYVVDSFGSMYCESVEHLVKKYKEALPGKEIGIHAHNNMQLAMSNTITSLMNGATMLDATLLGMGRGAGNCPIEILIAFLKNPKYRLLPLLQSIQEHVLPWNRKIDWGYHVPYLITGAMNEHPRSAMSVMDHPEKKDDFVSFMKSMHDYELLE